MVSKMLGSFKTGQVITIEEQLTDLIRGSGVGEEHALGFTLRRVGVSPEVQKTSDPLLLE